MAASELEIVKDIPGYKVILKAVLKGQIQQLVEQLAVHTDEESIILTASVADGTLSHLGSQFGKGFLENHEDIKSQFLGFCLRNHHKLQSQKSHHGDVHVVSSQMQSPWSGQRRLSPKLVSPQKQGLSPSPSTRSTPRVRHEPYTLKRNSGTRSIDAEYGISPVKTKCLASPIETESLTEIPDAVCDDTIEIKVEYLDSIEESSSTREKPGVKAVEMLNQSVPEREITENQYRTQDEATFQSEAGEGFTDINAKPQSKYSNQIIPNFPEGLIQKSGLDDFAEQNDSKTNTQSGSQSNTQDEVDAEVTVKVEAISESDMELEITGVELLESHAKQNTDHYMDMTFDPKSGASGSEVEGTNQQSRISQILMVSLSNPEKLTKNQNVESLRNIEPKRFASHSRDDFRKKIAGVVKGIGTSKEKSSWSSAVKQMGKSTERSNKQAAEIFRQFLIEKGEDLNFEVMGKSQLAKLLSDFYINARTKDGELYKLKSLTHIRSSLNRFLKSPPCSRKLDILHDEEFEDANRVFKAAIEEIKASGKGDTNHYPIITDSDLILLYSSKFLSPDTPSGLQNRVQMNLRLTFSRAITENMEKMTKDTFKFATKPDGTEYVYKQRNPDSNTTFESCDERFAEMLEDKDYPDLCPVRALKKYLSKLHPACERLWQYPVDLCLDTYRVWYQNKPVGKNTLAKFMSNLSKAVPLSKIYTNHSIRITGNSILNCERRPLKEVMALAAVKQEK